MQRHPTEMLSDARALGTGVIAFVAIIVIVALLYAMMDPAAELLFSTSSSAASSTAATDAIDERKQIWQALPIFFAFLAVIFLLSRAVFESRRPG